MAWVLRKTVVMVGMMGAGKSAVGRAVAQRIGAPIIDSDAEIESAAAMSIAEIFERDGEAFFRARESEVIERLLTNNRCILSTGGGAFLSERNREMIHRLGVSVWLDADLDVLWHRVRHKNTRPLLRTADPRGTLKSIYEARVPFYSMADLTVKTLASYSIEDTATEVLAALKTRPDVLEKVKSGECT